jgi:hypothetical protein
MIRLLYSNLIISSFLVAAIFAINHLSWYFGIPLVSLVFWIDVLLLDVFLDEMDKLAPLDCDEDDDLSDY